MINKHNECAVCGATDQDTPRDVHPDIYFRTTMGVEHCVTCDPRDVTGDITEPPVVFGSRRIDEVFGIGERGPELQTLPLTAKPVEMPGHKRHHP